MLFHELVNTVSILLIQESQLYNDDEIEWHFFVDDEFELELALAFV